MLQRLNREKNVSGRLLTEAELGEDVEWARKKINCKIYCLYYCNCKIHCLGS